MPSGPKGPVRRGQLIMTFGVGSMLVVKDGTSLMAAGLDHWYERESGNSSGIDIDEFKVAEWRLSRRLGVNHFRLPPDNRQTGPGQWVPNVGLTVPFLRFPQWHYCTSCGMMYLRPLTYSEWNPKCTACTRKMRLVQVPFVAVCDHGHIRDFPWREWVHETANPSCGKNLRLKVTGGATLGSQIVECECGVKRSLASITVADEDGTTYLTENLQKGHRFLCDGERPWLGGNSAEPCGRSLWGVLRSAANVYYDHAASSIYLPRQNAHVPEELLALLEVPPLSTMLSFYASSEQPLTPDILRTTKQREHFKPFTDAQLSRAIELVQTGDHRAFVSAPAETDDGETSFRREEFSVLRQVRSERDLVIKVPDPASYGSEVTSYFSRVSLIEKLTETRVFTGFTRVYPEGDQSPQELRRALWLTPPPPNKSWLPACKVHGEGLFLEFDEDRLREWQRRAGAGLSQRATSLQERYGRLQQLRHLRDRAISPRFLVAHTLAHLLINHLTFECGYSTAALRERLYISDDEQSPMCGILIYTAAGDAEGTMGGLVRMGKPGELEQAVLGAINGAQWCSADPVCMEMGSRGGQGPDSCNLAACHNCALLPETACEEFNRFLDRGVVVGSPGNREIGFFTPLMRSLTAAV